MALQTQQLATIVGLAAQGYTCRQISAALGGALHYSNVARRLQDEDVRAWVKAAQQEIMLRALPGAVEQYVDIVDRYPEYRDSNNVPMVSESLKAGRYVLQSVGILPSPAPSLIVQQINQSITVNNVDPALLARLQGNDTTPDVIDVEYEDG